jgi:MutT/NUDIX family protein
MEELGVSVHLGSEVQGDHPQGWVLNEKAAMRVFLAEISRGEPLPLQDHRELRWVSVKKQSGQDILDLPWIPADLPIVRELLSILHQS